MRLLALLAFSLPALAQFRVSDIAIYPSSNDVSTGQLQFLTRRADGKLVTIQAPTTATASYTLTLPTAAPASNGHCLTGTTAGVLSFAACGGSKWTDTGSDIYRNSRVMIGSTTAPAATLHVLGNVSREVARFQGSTDASNNRNFLSLYTTNPAFWWEVSNQDASGNGTTNGLAFLERSNAAPVARVYFASGGNVGVGTLSPAHLLDVNGTFRAAGAVTLASTLAVAGTATISSHILTTSPSTADIGDATNYFQTLNVENINAAPGGVAAAYTKVRKLEISDILGGTAFWDQRANATTVTSAWTLRDNGGSRALQAVRQEASSAANYVRVFGELRPAQRATADGDAVNDSAMPTLGNTSARWLSIWGDAATITNALSAGSATAGTITATTAFAGGTDGGTPIGSSSVRMGKIWGYDVDFAGTVKLGTSSTVGQVWTATGTDGSGDWATPGTSQWTTTGSDIYFSAGKVGIGNSSPAHRLDVTGSAKVYSGSGSTDSILYIGNADVASPGQGAFLDFIASAATPYFSINALSQGVAFRDVALANLGGSVCVGCTSPSTKLDVSGTFRATGAATFGSTSTFAGAVAVGSTDLTTATLFSRAADVNGLRIHNSGTPSPSGGAGIQAAIETAPASGDRLAFYAFGLRTGGANYNGANITAWATQNWSAGSAQGTELRFETTANGAASRNTSLTVRSGGIDVTGQVNTVGNFSISGAQVIDSSRNLVNIVDLTNTGNINSTGYVAGGSMRIGATAFINSSRELVNIVKLNAVSATVINYLANITSDVQFQFAQRGELGANNTWTQNNTFNGLTTFGGSVSAQASITTYDIVPATTNTYSNSTGSRYWLNTYTQYLTVGTGLTYPSGASNNYLLKTDGSGNASWTNALSISTITASGAITANGGIATASGTNSTMYVGSGNLYIRTFSGADASCGGVTNGWIGYRTDTNELQVCNGGSVRKVAL